MKIRIFIIFVMMSFLLCVPVYAAATPSDAVRSQNNVKSKVSNIKTDKSDKVSTSVHAKLDKDILIESYDYLIDKLGTLSGLAATPSNANRADSNMSEKKIKLRGNAFTPSEYKNVVIFNGTFNNKNCRLVIPYDSYKYLMIKNGVLINVGSGAVTGKVLYGSDEIYPINYDAYSYILGSVFGNTSSVLNYGSYNYQRHYYELNSRVVYDDLYGDFTVDDVKVYYSSDQRLYYLGLIILLFMGVGVLWKRH